MAIAQDASTPAAVHRAFGTSGTAASASFSPPSGSWVYVSVVWMFGTGVSSTLSVKDSLNNAYTAGPVETNISGCDAQIFRFFYSTAPGAITVTATCTSVASAAVLLVPEVLTGAATSQTGAASNQSASTGLVTVTTTTTGSWVLLAGGKGSTGTFTPNAATTSISTFADAANSGDQSGAGRATNPTGTPGATALGWTAGLTSMVGWEVLPAGGTSATVNGLVATATVVAPVGTASAANSATVNGLVAQVNVAAPTGTVLTGGPVPGIASVVSVVAPVGSVATSSVPVPMPSVPGRAQPGIMTPGDPGIVTATSTTTPGPAATATVAAPVGSQSSVVAGITYTFKNVSELAPSTTGVTLSNGKLSLACVPAYNYIQTGAVFNLTGSSVDIHVLSLPALGNGTTEAIWQMRYDQDNLIVFGWSGGYLVRVRQAGTNTGNSGLTPGVDITSNYYWRIREAGGVIFFDTSPDRSTWTNQQSFSHSFGSKLQTMRVHFESGYYGTETSPNPMVLGGVNVT